MYNIFVIKNKIIILDYSSFEKKHPILGVWDDHDYALNDANGYYPFKEQTKKFYLDFLDEPIHSGRRTEGKGIYTTYSFGVLNSHKTVRMILLDVRYNKTSYIRDTFEADILGEEQWAWLEETLMISQETFIFIASGTQILPFTRLTTESWYSKSRERLFELIGKVKKNGIVLLSGDIHCAELLKTFCVHPDIGYEIYEITSSGMSHFCDFKFFFELFVNNDYNIIPFIDTYNFGKIEFQWGKSKEESKFTIKFIDIERTIRGEYTINYNDLIYKKVDEKIDFYHRDCKTRLYSRFKSPLEYYFYYKNNLKGFLLVISGYILILSFFIGLLNLLLLIIRKPFNYIFKKKSLVKQE
jgi:alkaline phosphatase D